MVFGCSQAAGHLSTGRILMCLPLRFSSLPLGVGGRSVARPDAPLLLVASTPSRHPFFSQNDEVQDEVQIVVVCQGGDDSSASGAL